jgi:hypothetical protein
MFRRTPIYKYYTQRFLNDPRSIDSLAWNCAGIEARIQLMQSQGAPEIAVENERRRFKKLKKRIKARFDLFKRLQEIILTKFSKCIDCEHCRTQDGRSLAEELDLYLTGQIKDIHPMFCARFDDGKHGRLTHVSPDEVPLICNEFSEAKDLPKEPIK